MVAEPGEIPRGELESPAERKVFYYKMKVDYYRVFAEGCQEQGR